MMKVMKDEWYNLFLSRMQELPRLNGEDVAMSTALEVVIGGKKIVAGTRIIIDDILYGVET